jgi:glycosyltransferase involved in cell wall biosynthesis
MHLSVVTTSLNALPYIESTVKSVLSTAHADLEYLVIDAGSTDGTLEYLQGIRDSRFRLVVMPGSRPYEAVDWGLRNSSGEVLAWLNADDQYLPWTIACVARIFSQFPDVHWITGIPCFINGDGDCTLTSLPSSYPRRYIRNGWFNEMLYGNLVQESMFWRRSLYFDAGGLNLAYDQAADYELWCRFAQRTELSALATPLAAWRRHGKNRSLTGHSRYLAEVAEIRKSLPEPFLLKRWLCRSQAGRHALRCAEWHTAPWIYYSFGKSAWRHDTLFRPIARYSPQFLMRQFLASQQ